MPKYRWSCLLCHRGNSEKVEHCEYCGAGATATSWELDAREFAVKNILSGEETSNCQICGHTSHQVDFSEYPHEYFETKSGRPLFRAMIVLTKCNNCKHQIKTEYSVPTLRKLFRWVVGRDMQNEWWKNK